MQSYRRRRQKNALAIDDYSDVLMSAPVGSVPLSRTELFDTEQPLELEVGSGRGMFLLREAKRRPDVNFVGVEWASKFARETADLAIRMHLPNVRLFSCDAQLLIGYFEPQSLAAIHVLFPDPWWKRRHRGRRFVRRENIPKLAGLIHSGGQLHLATDVQEYFEKMLAAVASCPDFEVLLPPEIVAGTASGPKSDQPMTHFERKYRKEGRPIYRVVYRRR